MKLRDICALPVGEYLAAETCALLLWTTGPFLEEAMEVIKSWGFEYKTPMWVWVKRRGTGNVHCGLGRYTRSATEFCLLGVRGNVSQWRQSASVGQLIEIDNSVDDEPSKKRKRTTPDNEDTINVVDAEIRQHSRKPDVVFSLIDEFFPKDLPRIELFSREKRAGWSRWGNEINRF